MNITASASWKAIEAHRLSLAPVHLRQFFANDPGRVASLSLSYDGIYYDFSKQRIDSTTLALLAALAREARLDELTSRMFSGEKINASEDRSVLHVALRRSSSPFPSADLDVMPEVITTRQRMAAFADRIRSGQALGFTGMPIRHVVNIGIGGSDLGPKMLDYALRSISHPALGVHYVSNLDGAQLAPLLQTLDPRTTLFLVASKTFTTQETMLNAQTARDWLVANLGDDRCRVPPLCSRNEPNRSVPSSSASGQRLVFPLWDWVGGRFRCGRRSAWR
jgi:glucose-6-phosphate isomerase